MPLEDDVTVCASPLAVSVRVIFAPTITAPVWSVIDPLIPPVTTLCAAAMNGSNNASSATMQSGCLNRIFLSSFRLTLNGWGVNAYRDTYQRRQICNDPHPPNARELPSQD